MNVVSRRIAWSVAVALAALGGLALANPQHRAHDLKALDSDGDRAISRDEIASAASARFAAIDANRDAQITLEEIHSYREQQRAERQAQRLARLDANKDGRITQDEFVARRVERLQRFDRNDDGVLDAADRRLHCRG